MPNGTTVYYRDSDHQYNRDNPFTRDGRIPGISTISKHDGDANSDPLMDWAVRLAYEGVARHAARELSEDWLANGETIAAKLRSSGDTWREVRDAKGKVGTVSHGVLQALAEGVTPILRTGYDHAVVDWWKKRRPEVLDAERVTYSAEQRYAGRFDLRARITTEITAPYAIPNLQGKVALTDAKTSGFISNSFHIQAEGYDLANVECGIGPSDVRLILQLGEDGSWCEWESRGTHADFVTALNAYRMGRRISNAARADWKQMKAAGKQRAVAV